MSVLITGAAHRIGRAIALKFHEAGFNLLLHCNQSTKAANTLAFNLNYKRKNSARVVIVDLAETERIEEFAETCFTYTDKLVALINNAAVFYPTPFTDVTPEQFDNLLSINLRAPYFLAKSFSKHLAGGSIINIVDMYAEKPLKGFSAYSISKAGLTMMTKSLALELAPRIRVNGISPGAILWPEGNDFTGERRSSLLANIPLGEMGDPTDIANAALFLVEKADYITGEIISVDGGSSI